MTKGSPWQLSRAAISAIERGQNFPGMEAMLALSNVLFVDPKELIERARLSTAAPVDVTDVELDALEERGLSYFWAGDYRKAAAVYDAMLEKIALEDPEPSAEMRARMADLEVQRANALRRAGAILSAMATAERAIVLADGHDDIQSRAYIVLAGLQIGRGHLPLAADAADRAVELSADGDLSLQGQAWICKAGVLFMRRRYDEAREAFLEARRLTRESGDSHHLTHVEGNVGMCWLERGQFDEARKWVRRAVDLARQEGQPLLEASWLVELGKIAEREGARDEADSYAQAALRIAKPRDHHLTIFRAEWLRHRLVKHDDPEATDRHRMAYLRKLFLNLDQHEGVDEVRQFRSQALRGIASDTGTTS